MRQNSGSGELGMSLGATSFEVKACEVRYYGPHRSLPNRMTGVVRVEIEECLLGNITRYKLDLKVKTDIGHATAAEVRTALLAHAAHQLNKLKNRHLQSAPLPMAAE